LLAELVALPSAGALAGRLVGAMVEVGIGG
jgi:hypothetical protein